MKQPQHLIETLAQWVQNEDDMLDIIALEEPVDNTHYAATEGKREAYNNALNLVADHFGISRGAASNAIAEAKQRSAALHQLEAKYGHDFKLKLPRYRTAKLKGEYVRICEVDTRTFDVLVQDAQGKHHNCNVTDLTDFVL
jgi:hypothetical protein